MTELSPAEQADEMLLMGLRLSEGIDLERLASLGKVRPDPAVIEELVGLGLLQVASATFPADGRLGRLAPGRA